MNFDVSCHLERVPASAIVEIDFCSLLQEIVDDFGIVLLNRQMQWGVDALSSDEVDQFRPFLRGHEDFSLAAEAFFKIEVRIEEKPQHVNPPMVTRPMHAIPLTIHQFKWRSVVPQEELQKIHLVINHTEEHEAVLVEILTRKL